MPNHLVPDDAKLLLVGSGQIAHEYVKALRATGVSDISVLSQHANRSKAFAEQYGLVNSFGGGKATLEAIGAGFDGIVLAASIPALLELLETCCISAPNAAVLVEKPLALSRSALALFLQRYPQCAAQIALNRLYFPSLARMREVLGNEPVTSVQFSFTEWIDRIDPSMYDSEVLARWGVANCIHVISTVFDTIGLPSQIAASVGGQGRIKWHPSGSVFTGSGIAGGSVPFSYQSDWTSAGRWSIRFYTERGCYILEPMEEIKFVAKGTIVPIQHMSPYTGPTKCGFEPMLRTWLNASVAGPRVTVAGLVDHLKVVEAIFGYGG